MTLDYFYGQAGELFSFYRIPKALFQEPRFQSLSTDAKTLYGILLDRMSLSAKNGWLDEQGRVFIIFTIEDVKRALCCADNKATKLLRELEEFGLIERKRRGLGKPSLVYVKNFSAESSKSIFQNRDFHDSGGFKSASQDPAKPRCNKTEENNTEMSETYPFYSEEEDGMSKREQLEEYFSQSLEVDTLLRLCPDDEDTIYQIVDLLVDTCATNRKMLRIAGDDKPAEVVRSRFMKLNADHMHILDEIIDKMVRQIFSRLRGIPKEQLITSRYAKETAERKNHLQALQTECDKAEKDLLALKAEILAVIKGESAFPKDTLAEMIAAQEKKHTELETLCEEASAELERNAELMANVSQLYEELISYADLYDSASFEAKKMIVSQLIRRVDVYRGYQIHVDFNFDLAQYLENSDELAC